MKKSIFLALVVPVVLFASENYWQDIHQNDLMKSVNNMVIEPDKYRALKINYQSFVKDFNLRLNDTFTAPLLKITLPKPNGKMSVFEVSPYDIMDQELKEKFPELQTFHGFNVSDPKEKVYFDITPKGLHAMISGGKRSFLIDPVSHSDNNLYVSYYRNDYTNKQIWKCAVEGHNHATVPVQVTGTAPTNQLELKRYRLAVAATGEYTSFHGGTVADGMAAIVTAMVRVNGIYEIDVGIRMILVANNDLIIYTDGNNDPYTNNSGGSMLGQNQTNLDAVIGSANYDIGHVFSTGGGGVASLGVPCSNGAKARGVTGLGNPIGDVFWVDYVAHEMGHQWGANHTFNSITGACGGGNRSGSSAYEPGSATTILGYAGICGSDNIQNNSDPYFHARSLDVINSFATFGGGSNCSDIQVTGNLAPSVSILSPSSLTIPINTAFELCADASDADTNDNNLTYNWEQYNLGPAGSPNNPSGDAPIFRSFNASSSGCRVFPQLSDIQNNTQTKGEILPSYDRILNFRTTVRDNELNGGAFNTEEYSVQVTSTSGPFLITAPNTAMTLNTNDFIDVEWEVANTDVAPVNCSAVDITISLNGDVSNDINIILNTPNDGIENIQIPEADSDQVRFKVKCSDNVFFDISNTDLTIIGFDRLFADSFE